MRSRAGSSKTAPSFLVEIGWQRPMLKGLELGPGVSRIHRIRLNRIFTETSICDIFIPAGKIGSCTLRILSLIHI